MKRWQTRFKIIYVPESSSWETASDKVTAYCSEWLPGFPSTMLFMYKELHHLKQVTNESENYATCV